jgi:hypothetical protein
VVSTGVQYHRDGGLNIEGAGRPTLTANTTCARPPTGSDCYFGGAAPPEQKGSFGEELEELVVSRVDVTERFFELGYVAVPLLVAGGVDRGFDVEADLGESGELVGVDLLERAAQAGVSWTQGVA